VTGESVCAVLDSIPDSSRALSLLTNLPGAPRRNPSGRVRPLARRTLNALASLLRSASLPTDTAYAAALLTDALTPDALTALHLKPRPCPTWFGHIRHTINLANED